MPLSDKGAYIPLSNVSFCGGNGVLVIGVKLSSLLFGANLPHEKHFVEPSSLTASASLLPQSGQG